MPANSKGFDDSVTLPPELTIGHIAAAIEHVEDRAAEFVDVYFEQANVFSCVIGILGIQALGSLTPYKKHKHPDVAQQRFPDLSLKGKLNPPPNQALESKGSKRPWSVQSHYDHPGWYIVWRYAIDVTKRMKPGKTAAIWRVDVVFLQKSNWKYEGSKAAEGIGGRTHTFGVKDPAQVLRSCIVYQNPRVRLRQGGPVLRDLVE